MSRLSHPKNQVVEAESLRLCATNRRMDRRGRNSHPELPRPTELFHIVQSSKEGTTVLMGAGQILCLVSSHRQWFHVPNSDWFFRTIFARSSLAGGPGDVARSALRRREIKLAIRIFRRPAHAASLQGTYIETIPLPSMMWIYRFGARLVSVSTCVLGPGQWICSSSTRFAAPMPSTSRGS